QSGIDKIADRHGNLEFLQGHFAKSPLAGMVPFLVTVVTVLEIVSGALSAIGCVIIILTRDPTVAFYGAIISAISIVALFFAQRINGRAQSQINQPAPRTKLSNSSVGLLVHRQFCIGISRSQTA